MNRLILGVLVLAAGCATTPHRVGVEGDPNHAATLRVVGNQDGWSDFILMVLTLGFLPMEPHDEVEIRKVNGTVVHAKEVLVATGQCEVDLAFAGKDGRRSKALLPLKFKTLPGGSYAITWSASGLRESWSAEVQAGDSQAKGDGELFLPDPTQTKGQGYGAGHALHE